MMTLHRIREIETKLYSSNFEFVDYYSMLSNEDLMKAKKRLMKEYQLSSKLNKPLKDINEILEIVDLIIEKKNLLDLVAAEEDDKKGTVLG